MKAAYERGKPAAGDLAAESPKVLIELDGAHEIVRFCVNLLFQQVEFMALGAEALYRLRREMGAERFNSYLTMLYDEDRLRHIRRCVRRPEYMRFVRKMDGLPDVEPPTPPLEDRIAQAIGDPGSIVGNRIHTSFGDERDETITRWATRAVLAVLDGLPDVAENEVPPAFRRVETLAVSDVL